MKLLKSTILGASLCLTLTATAVRAQYPDYISRSFTCDKTSLRAGERVTCSSEIFNQTIWPSTRSVTSGYLLARNAALSSGDRVLHAFTTPVLGPRSGTTHSASFTLPDINVDGRVYIGVKANIGGGQRETNISNNTRSQSAEGYGTDLTITSFTGVPQTSVEGATYSYTVEVQQTGRQTSRHVRLGIFLGRFVGDTRGTMLLDVVVDPLTQLAKRSYTLNFKMLKPVSGMKYLVAVVDHQVAHGEIDPFNNTASRSTTFAASRDLVTRNLTASTTTWEVGKNVTLSSRTVNTNSLATSPSKTGYYLSANRVISTTDKLIGTYDVPLLGQNGYWQATQTFRLPETPSTGQCYLGVYADRTTTNIEVNEANNSMYLVGNCENRPDLQVSNLSASTTTWQRGTRVTITSRTTNIGSGGAAAHQTGYYLSTNTTISASDQLLGTVDVPFLGRTGWWQTNRTVTMPRPFRSGTCYLGAWADHKTAITEINENNNSATVRGTCENRSDLVVSSLGRSTSSWRSGASVTVTSRTSNSGAEASVASTTSYYLSTNSTISRSDVLLLNASVPALARGAGHNHSAAVRVPLLTQTGTCYLGAIADRLARNVEISETNNTRAVAITCTRAADLKPTITSAPSTVNANSNVVLRYTVQNLGDDASGIFYVQIGLGSTRLARFALPSIAGGQTTNRSFTVHVPAYQAASSQTQLTLVVDPDSTVTELDERNNSAQQNLRVVGYSGNNRYVQFRAQQSGQRSNYVTLDMSANQRTVDLEVTAPTNPNGYYLLLWSARSTFQIDALTDMGLTLLNTPILPNWFAALDANGRTSRNRPRIVLPNLSLSGPIDAFMHGIFWTPTFALNGVADAPISRVRIQR